MGKKTKKIKSMAIAGLRLGLLATPGIAAGYGFWNRGTAEVVILAALAVEIVFLAVFAFTAVAIYSGREMRRGREAEIEAALEN